MKINWNRKYFTVSLYAFLTVSACICFYMMMKNFPAIGATLSKVGSILKPFLYGFVIAYLVNPTEKAIARFAHRLFLKRAERINAKNSGKSGVKEKKVPEKLISGLSIVLSYVVFLLVIGIFVWILVPQVAKSILEIKSNFKLYSDQAVAWLQSVLDLLGKYNAADFLENILGVSPDDFRALLNKAMDLFNRFYPSVVSFVDGFVQEFMNFVIGFIISIYMLINRDKFKMQIRKIMTAALPDNAVTKVYSVANEADKCFGGYIIGQIIDSLLIGVIWFILMTVLGFPYPFLISLIVGVTNMIPFFGPFIGGIPSGIIILLTKPQMTVFFILLVIVVQQIDGNFIAPRIIGQATGISAFWIIFALLLMGGLFGIVGMIIAVPLFSLCYRELKLIIEMILEKKGKPRETSEYGGTDKD